MHIHIFAYIHMKNFWVTVNTNYAFGQELRDQGWGGKKIFTVYSLVLLRF